MEIYKSKSDKPLLDWQWKEPSLRNLTHLILKFAPRNGGQALDVGCGTGRVSFALAERGFEVKGVDIEERAITLARSLATEAGQSVQFEVADFLEPGLVKQDSYDLVVCAEVLEHVRDYRRMIDNMHTALRPGGRLIITVPLDLRRWSVLDDYSTHIRRYTIDQVEKELHQFCNVKTFVTGFPFYRLLVLAYLAKIRLFGEEHSIEQIWGKSSIRLIATLAYPFVRLDNLFSFTRLGDMLVVAGDKRHDL
jgi:SAM-dependent methyltransferase